MRIKELRELHNMQQKTLANILGISSNTLSQYENGKREPGIDIVSKIAKYFNVSTDYVYGISILVTCNDCGLSYCPDVKLDIETHKELHSKWEKAKEIYGFCYANYGENERIKATSRNIAYNTSLPLNERYDAQIEVFKCLFSRSLSASNYSEKHVNFETYVAMMLNQESVRNKLDEELYNQLLTEYGKQPGISNGQTYYDICEYEDPTTIAAHKDGENFTPEELQKIEEYKKLLIAARPKE